MDVEAYIAIVLGHTALVLGAGFSKPRNGPLLVELLTEEYIEVSSADRRALDAMVELLKEQRSQEADQFTIEDLFTTVWVRARTGGAFTAIGEEWEADELLSELVQHLVSICENIRLDMRYTISKRYVQYFQWLFENSRTLTVATFNYDTLVEQCLQEAEIPFGYGPVHGLRHEDPEWKKNLPPARDRVSVLKLHGSANWGVCRGCNEARHTQDLVTIMESIYGSRRRKRCPHCEEAMLEIGVIPPVIGKATEASQFREVWKKARERLGRAREIIVVGYSLPETDQEAMDLLREVFQPKQRPRVTIVTGKSGAPASYQSVFPRFDDTEMYFEDYIDEIDY